MNGKPKWVKTVVMAAQNNGGPTTPIQKRNRGKSHKTRHSRKHDGPENYVINGTGRFVIGGTLAESGLTGRKIIVDTYGGVGSPAADASAVKTHQKLIVQAVTWHDTLQKTLSPQA